MLEFVISHTTCAVVGPEDEEVSAVGDDSEGGFAKFGDVFDVLARDREVEDAHALPDGRAGVAGPEDVDADVGDDERRVVDRERGGDGFAVREEVLCQNASERRLLGAGRRILRGEAELS